MVTFKRQLIRKLGIEHHIDLLLFNRKLNTPFYRKQVQDICKKYDGIIKKSDTVFDVGANIGNYTAAFCETGAKVICIEPQQYCLDFLNIRFKNKPEVIIVPYALDAVMGEKKIFISDATSLSSMSEEWLAAIQKNRRFPGIKWNKSKMVATTTLDTLISQYGLPAYCKIDVEGFEYNVLQGLHQKIPLLSIEYTFEYIGNTIKCLSYLQTLGEIKVSQSVSEETINLPATWLGVEDAVSQIKKSNDTMANGDLFIKFV